MKLRNMFVSDNTVANLSWRWILICLELVQLKRQQKTESSRWLTARKPKAEDTEMEETAPTQRDRFKTVDNGSAAYVQAL